MESVKKRKLAEHEESDRNMMILLKRLHLDKTSELYEKVPLFERKAVGCKRWRLSPIKEYEQGAGGGVKRRRVDSDMADQMSSSLWISDSNTPTHKKKTFADSWPPETTSTAPTPDFSEPPDELTDDVFDPDPAPSGSAPKISVNIDLGTRMLALDEQFIRRQMREQSMQLVLWSPPLVLLGEDGDELQERQEECKEDMEFDMC